MNKIAIYGLLAVATFLGSCSKKSDNGVPQRKCLADKLTFTNSSVKDVPSLHIVLLTFDVKNTGTDVYDVASGANPVYMKLTATTTSGKTYETETIMDITHLSAGATASADAQLDYGAGNTYASFKLEQVYCK